MPINYSICSRPWPIQAQFESSAHSGSSTLETPMIGKALQAGPNTRSALVGWGAVHFLVASLLAAWAELTPPQALQQTRDRRCRPAPLSEWPSPIGAHDRASLPLPVRALRAEWETYVAPGPGPCDALSDHSRPGQAHLPLSASGVCVESGISGSIREYQESGLGMGVSGVPDIRESGQIREWPAAAPGSTWRTRVHVPGFFFAMPAGSRSAAQTAGGRKKDEIWDLVKNVEK